MHQPGTPGYLADANSNTYENPKGLDQYRAGLDHYKNLNALTSALDLADTGYTPGTKLSTELYRQGAFLSEVLTDPGQTRALPTDPSSINNTISNVVDVASRNTDATTVILTGDGTPEQLGSGYHRDSAVVALLEHDWPGGVENSPMHKMLDYISTDAHSDNLEDATRAGKSARALADVISSTKSPGGVGNFDSLFKDNSPSMRYVAQALSPYVGNMVDVPENLLGTHGFGNLDPVESTRVFTLMDNDQKSAAILNGAAIAQAYEFDQEFARGEGGQDLALYSGRLHGLIEGGIAANTGLHGYDATSAATHSKEVLGAGYMSAKEFFNAGVGAVTDALPGKSSSCRP